MANEIKILFIKDTLSDSVPIMNVLNNSGIDFEVFIADEFIPAHEAFVPDVILFDHQPYLPDPMEVFTSIKKNAAHIPFIILTSQGDEQFALSLMRLGADDYIMRDRPCRLPFAIAGAVEGHGFKAVQQKNADQLTANGRSEAILNSLRSNIVLLNEAGDIIAANESWKKLVHSNMPELPDYGVGSNYLTVAEKAIGITRLKIAEIAKGIEDVVNGSKDSFKTEYRYALSVKEQWFNIVITPLINAGQKAVTILHIDSTDRKLAEKALIQARVNSSAIIENTTDLVYSLDRELNFITYNQLFKNTIGNVYGFDVKQGVNILNMLWEYDNLMAQKWSDIYEKALKGDAVQFVNEYDYSGAKIYLSYSLNPIWEDGEVTGLSCFSRDITRQKMDELALKKSEASLRTIFNNTDMAYLLIDDDLKLVSFNEPAQIYSIEQNAVKLVEGSLVFEYFDAGRKGAINDILNRAKNGEIINYQLNLQSDGVEKWFDVTWAGIKNSEHESVGYLLTNREITEKKKSEIEREKITADLIKRNKDLEQFTYIISHNLRAPLANIMGLSNLLSDLVPEEIECLEIVSGITVSANKLDDVISDLNQILQVSYLSEKNEHVVLSELLEDIKRSIGYLIKKEKARLVYDFTIVNSLFTLKSYLLSIFYNLVMNSIKYRKPEADPVINITSKVENNKIVISYRDNGRGIDTVKNRTDLFGLYKRFDTSVEGKGMGLFMIKMQIESLGGKITLHSEINKGTEFELEFPLTQLYQNNNPINRL